MTTQTTDKESTYDTQTAPDTSRTAAVGGAVADAAGTVKGAADAAAARLPEVAATTRTVIEDANRQMRSGSDRMLTIGSALSFGLAGGLLLGGAPRLVVAGALLPAVMMVLTLVDRSERSAAGTSGRSPQSR